MPDADAMKVPLLLNLDPPHFSFDNAEENPVVQFY
jgi:hypothetical protein